MLQKNLCGFQLQLSSLHQMSTKQEIMVHMKDDGNQHYIQRKIPHEGNEEYLTKQNSKQHKGAMIIKKVVDLQGGSDGEAANLRLALQQGT